MCGVFAAAVPVRLRLALFALVTLPAGAQVCDDGGIRVLVRDSQGAAIFDARVKVSTGATTVDLRSTTTTGVADFSKVPCGEWSISAIKEGFEESVAKAPVSSGGLTELTLMLAPQINRTNLEVSDTVPPIEQSSSIANELRPIEVKALTSNPPAVLDTLPLVPGVVRATGGELKIDGSGEERSSLVVNQSDVTDPATGHFGQTVPVDSIENVSVLNTPFLAQYGRFTQSVVAVDTRRGGDKWHADLNDPFPDFRIRSYHMQGIRNETPRASAGGPLLRNRLYLMTALQYLLDKVPSRTLPFPHNESKHERVNSFTQFDFVASSRNLITFTYHFSPEHTNFVNPDYFNPQSVTSSYAQRAYVATLADHFGIFGGTLDTTFSMQRFHTFIGAQGDAPMVLTPGGNEGNYFGVQSRDAWRREALMIFSPAPINVAGPHLPKLGVSVTVASDRGHFAFRPVEIVNSDAQLFQRIDWVNPGNYGRTDLEVTAYAQDHWSPSPKLSFDYGVRLEHQRLAQNLRIAPRSGLAWSPLPDGRTVLRVGYGEFYDHIPLDVYAFSRYPLRTVTDYAPNGAILGTPVQFTNVIGSVTGPPSFLVHGQRVAGAFSPRGYTWNTQIEHVASRRLRLRAGYSDNHSVGLIVLEPEVSQTTNEIVLDGNGRSRYRQLEFTAKLAVETNTELVFSYVRSRAEGGLNVFDAFLGNLAAAKIHPNVYTNLPGDLPNRFLLWGRIDPHWWKLRLLPTIEYRNGFPYTVFDAAQNYAGVPNAGTRFPDFFSADSRVMRDFRVSPKYALRLSVTGFNLTNHFNALAVHSNTADPQYGIFFGNYHRWYRFDFEVIF